MKKAFLIFLILVPMLLLFAGQAQAYADGCRGPNNSDPGATGLVPCGVSRTSTGALACPCELGHIFELIMRVYTFIVWYVATPLAALLLAAGGLTLVLAGGNPNLASTAKSILWGAVIGLLLILGSWVIIDVILMTIGYNPPTPWNRLNF